MDIKLIAVIHFFMINNQYLLIKKYLDFITKNGL
jgi:hypothetical protein